MIRLALCSFITLRLMLAPLLRLQDLSTATRSPLAAHRCHGASTFSSQNLETVSIHPLLTHVHLLKCHEKQSIATDPSSCIFFHVQSTTPWEGSSGQVILGSGGYALPSRIVRPPSANSPHLASGAFHRPPPQALNAIQGPIIIDGGATDNDASAGGGSKLKTAKFILLMKMEVLKASCELVQRQGPEAILQKENLAAVMRGSMDVVKVNSRKIV